MRGSLYRMVYPFAPIEEKLSMNFCCIALIAVLIPTNAIIPNAIIATVRPVRNLLAFTVRNASNMLSREFTGAR
jgi:hypothetical protein